MAQKLANRARMNVASAPGTGTIALGSATTGMQSFAAAGVANGDIVPYTIEDGAAWEYGLGTYSTTGPSLARTTPQGSSTGSPISASATAEVFITPNVSTFSELTGAAGAGFNLLRTTILTSSGQWTRSTDAKLYYIELIGGGAGGGSGYRAALATASGTACGGAGGQGGCVTELWIPAAFLPTTIDFIIGAGGTGGAAQTADTSSGLSSNAGGNTSMFFATNQTGGVSQLTSAAGGSLSAGGGTGTSSNPAATKSPGFSSQNFVNTGGQGKGNAAGQDAQYGGTSGGHGGGGAGLSNSNGASYAGGSGSFGQRQQYSGASMGMVANGGAAPSGNGGGDTNASLPYYGSGGGGGGSAVGSTSAASAGGNGGNGAIPGGGGGGGGAGKGANSGKGGDGARGEIRIYEFG